MSDKEHQMIERAEQRIAAAHVENIPFADGTVVTYRFEPETSEAVPTVVLIHGWTGRAAFMSAFVAPLTVAGFRVIAVDLPGHGRSSGKTLNLARAAAALTAVHARTGPWHGVIGHSFGGAVATTFVTGAIKGFAPIPIKRLVLIAAPESMPAVFRNFGGIIGLGPRAQKALEDRVLDIAGNPLETFRGAALLQARTIATLVIHAPDDKEVDFRNAAAFAAAGPHVEVVEAPGTGHRRILYAPAVLAATVGHMRAAEAATG
jgi:pimeloyl-ACP methyl ester carboxylesterase